ncbi:MAG: alcohol dehydrogenase catalytic domain-containing protein [Nitrospiraceae bacterium]|nr:alcohol dehydrogenase catalytic domain-containing protein [Nitrospiraceae bacterium]
MKVAVYYSNTDLRIEERPVPRISEDEILVRMMASGICGTDVIEWYRQQKAPRVLGHEMAGEVVETGSRVSGFRKGDRVFVSHHVPCYECDHCRNSDYTACEALHTGNYEPGGFSEYIRVPAMNVRYGTFLLPEGMRYEEAAMIEPLACVIAGQRQLEIGKRDTVLVIGAGVSGLLHIQMAKLKGAIVVATDISEYRLGKALEFGADHVFHADEFSEDALKNKKINKSGLARRVIVCAGARQALDHAVRSVGRRGVILFFAVPADDICLPSARFWRDEIAVSFSYGAAPDDLREALALIEGGKVNAGKMITHRYPLSDIQKGFALVAGAGESLKVVIVAAPSS